MRQLLLFSLSHSESFASYSTCRTIPRPSPVVVRIALACPLRTAVLHALQAVEFSTLHLAPHAPQHHRARHPHPASTPHDAIIPSSRPPRRHQTRLSTDDHIPPTQPSNEPPNRKINTQSHYPGPGYGTHHRNAGRLGLGALEPLLGHVCQEL